jgi:hypothetical protein
MNNFKVYSFIDDFDDFLQCVDGLECFDFSEPPTEFNHWCSESDTENPSWHCLDCCYIRKYHVRNYYVLIHKENISLHKNNDCDTKLCSYKLANFEFASLLFHFKIKDGKKCLYISTDYIKPLNNCFEHTFIQTYFNEKIIRDIIDELVKHCTMAFQS